MLCIGTMGSKKTIAPHSKGDKGYLNGWDKGKDLLSLMMDVSEYWQVTMASHYLEERLTHVDDPNVHEIDLADSSEQSADLLKRYGVNRAQEIFGVRRVKDFFSKEAPKPKFYNTSGDMI
jgi:hypothetical protein